MIKFISNTSKNISVLSRGRARSRDLQINVFVDSDLGKAKSLDPDAKLDPLASDSEPGPGLEGLAGP